MSDFVTKEEFEAWVDSSSSIISANFDKLIQRLDDIKAYDDSELREEINSIETYDDSGLKSMVKELNDKIPNPYDDSSLRDEFMGIVNAIKSYDDTALRDEFIGMVKSIKQYDDSVIINMIEDVKNTKVEFVLKNKAPIDYVAGNNYATGDYVVHNNSLYFNKMDNNDTEPTYDNKSYAVVIKAPRNIEHKGLYQEGVEYDINNIVMKDNSSWIKVCNGHNELPSEGWKLLAKEGKRGRRGEKGDATHTTLKIDGFKQIIADLNDEIILLIAEMETMKKDIYNAN